MARSGWREWACWLIRRRLRFRVEGLSMLPILGPGDEVLCNPHETLKVGDIVVARHPHRGDVRVIKRLAAFDDRGHAFLEGTNPTESTDSRTLGAVPPDLLLGRVTSLLSQPTGAP
ncbi:MAG: nickel-type superoxide dismutase maturation protease [Myxococcota bacterium]|nr:nickel-type superoxide dismutase maturation protease [Myxococcota bacterium]